jgi:hypothetical protein
LNVAFKSIFVEFEWMKEICDEAKENVAFLSQTTNMHREMCRQFANI